ncbi:MAG: BtpA/SgcQ family protein [Lachnospiraceae bacterium]|nr:BtpA/SgcQ family protein [Lachnospiraceae bacterium]
MSKELLSKGSQTIIGMVHCLPLPGTCGFDGNYSKIMDRAVEDAITLEKAGVDALIVENMGDTPFAALLDKAQITALTAAAVKVREAVKIPIGIDAAFNDCEVSLSIAAMCGASFIRVPVFVDTVLFSDGIIYPCARKCMNFRRSMGLEHVRILADVQVKHANMLNPQITVEMSAKDAVSNGADGIIVTGAVVGAETPIDMLKRVQKVVKVPVFAGSGVNRSNIHDQLQIADGCIIGSSLKKDGILTNPIDYDLVREVVEAL